MKTDDSLIGIRLANYQIDQLIGRGGMASVYFGRDVKLDRPVAIKVIDARYRGKPAFAERFVREARVLAGWHHPNITQIYYADNQEDLYYYVMEYIRGLDLGQLLRRYHKAQKLLPHPDVLWIGRAVAEALDYAHGKRVIHRDVKPSNVLVSEDGRIVLTDFGLAMDVEVGSIGEVFGSPMYMSPEQAQNSASVRPPSDLYSLGVMLYEMLAGQVPFNDPSPTALAFQHVTREPPPPRSLNPQLNRSAERVLLKALHKRPEERYQTGRELMDALEAALNEVEETGAYPVDLPQPLPETQPFDTGEGVEEPARAEDDTPPGAWADVERQAPVEDVPPQGFRPYAEASAVVYPEEAFPEPAWVPPVEAKSLAPEARMAAEARSDPLFVLGIGCGVLLLLTLALLVVEIILLSN